jgi:prepilin-type N-terminal cleavage/methylation domain-containing protein
MHLIAEERGFTLVELLTVMAISVVLLGATFTAFIAHENVVGRGRQTVTNREDTRAVLHMMATEIQMAGFPRQSSTCLGSATTVGAANSVFMTATASTLRLKMDANQDGDCADTNEDITYTLTGTQITRNGSSSTIGSTPQPLLDNVTALSLQYWCATNPNDTPVGPVIGYGTGLCVSGMRIVRVDLSITVQNRAVAVLAVGTGETRPTQTFSTSVVPRNMFVS